MAGGSDDPDVSPSGGEVWGTLEELLLASAVSRHGTASWDAVATEVRSRSTSVARLTAGSCRVRYGILRRRFAAAAGSCVVEELRKLRVAELRREVERCDLSIGSLKSKVKLLEEEREKERQRIISDETTPEVKEEAGAGPPKEAGSRDRLSGEESGRSCEESNSSDPKQPGHDDVASTAVKEEPAAGEVAPKEEASGESVAGSKEADKEKNGDVQSSSSPSRGKAAGEEADAEAASTSMSVPLPAAESEPLLAFLETIRTSKPGSLFQHRLESQEGDRYTGIIRRHVDLEAIGSRLEPGAAEFYASTSEFYRDLLLLCANALIFFPCGSPEHAAATRMRALVSMRLSASPLHKLDGNESETAAGKSAAASVVSGLSAAGVRKPMVDSAEVAGSLLEKAAPVMVCRKRSSIAKASAAAAAKEEKVELAEDEDMVDKKNAGAKYKDRGLRTNKNRGPVRNTAPNQKAEKASESAADAEGSNRSDKVSGIGKAAAGGAIKKRKAVDFLNRMKQNSVPSTSTERVSLLETLKLSAATEQKKPGKDDGQDEPGSSGSKRAAATSSSSRGRKRGGRPPKRAAAAPPSPPPPPAKRSKDGGRPARKRK